MRLGLKFLLAAASSLLLGGGADAQEQNLKPEKISVSVSDPSKPRVYLADVAINHIVDGRLHVLDGADLSYIGLIGTSLAGSVYISPQRDTVYVATSYYPKLTRGERSDWLEFYDAATLALKDEIQIPNKRAQALNYRPLFQGSSDGSLLFLQNATPATSVMVIDVKARKVRQEIANPGCYGIYPAAGTPTRFSTLCGDGAIGTYSLHAKTAKDVRKSSGKIFDADKDALFIHGERDGAFLLLLSFGGVVYRVSVEEATAKLIETVAMTTGIEGNWRPGGYQPMAFDAKTGMLYALMHKGGAEGSHKNPSEEIWAYSLKEKKLVSRSPSQPLTSIALAQSGPVALYGVNPVDGALVRYNVTGDGGVKEDKSVKVGEAVVLVEAR